MSLDGLNGELGTGRLEAAGWRKQRRNETLVAPYQKNQGSLHGGMLEQPASATSGRLRSYLIEATDRALQGFTGDGFL
jgi:hypothetical protein